MSFGIGLVVGAIVMLVLQFGALGVFALKEVVKGSRKGMKYIEAAEETDYGAKRMRCGALYESK